MKYLEFNKKIGEGIFPVYLIEGEESYFRDKAVDSIRSACISEPSLNDDRVEGENLKGEKLTAFRDSLYTLPFLSEKRMVRVYEFYPTEREAAILLPYFEKPCPSTVLLIVNSKKKGGADLKRKKGVTYVDCARESEEIVGKWLYGTLRRANVSADMDAVQKMVRYCGSDCARMYREIEKLKLLLGEGGRLTSEAVEEYVNKDIDYKIYEMTAAAARKNYSVFTEIAQELMGKGYDELALLAFLTGYYKTLCDVGECRGSDAEIAEKLDMKPYAVQKNREQLTRTGLARARELYTKLYLLSSGAKSGEYQKDGALFVAIAELFFGGK